MQPVDFTRLNGIGSIVVFDSDYIVFDRPAAACHGSSTRSCRARGSSHRRVVLLHMRCQRDKATSAVNDDHVLLRWNFSQPVPSRCCPPS
ncbi:hypothetical protein GUJ93_ZPchr0007g5922 [Zizania palustris]|uniref:Uncharacterized protein n=1 Tax=Zizania palustris TaxID=103762 RepID=A0A8J5SUZ0_ZIZPA|nr:hypothetical protein GUJ93_ZPchr0007g5922 [Zizania palustris]